MGPSWNGLQASQDSRLHLLLLPYPAEEIGVTDFRIFRIIGGPMFIQFPAASVSDTITRLCPNDGHADPPLKKDHLKKVVMNGAECSE